MPRYVRLIAANRFDEALAVIGESIPFPAVCGYVCPAFCELKCHLAQITDAPEAIRRLKRFLADQTSWQGHHHRSPPTGKKVAIVGAGPAGLTAAYYLTLQGHKSTVFEALAEPGGMMRVGIPPYRLPKSVLDGEVARILKAGVELVTNTRVDSLDHLFSQGYQAVFLALGAQRGARMGIKGEDGPGVIDALYFLRQVNLGSSPQVGRRVVVVGGGNSAVDAGRSALRLGAGEVTVVYRRTRKEMRAYPEEITEALREGIRIIFLATPAQISRKNGCLELVCLQTRPGGADLSVPPQVIEGSEFVLEADLVIAAVGQEPDIPKGFSLSLKGKNILTDPESMSTPVAGVFAGGDCVTGSSSVIEAIAAGKRAAGVIDSYLGGLGTREAGLPETPPELKDVIKPTIALYPPPTAGDCEVSLLPVGERFNGFPLVELSLSPEEAVREANRCLGCDLPLEIDENKCRSCFICQLVCSLRWEGAFSPTQAAIRILPTLRPDKEVAITISFDDRCDDCGLCVRYCPSGALTRGLKARETKDG